MFGYLSADIICTEKRTVFRERSSRNTVSYEEQIMSKDKYPSIFSRQMATIVFIILQIFFATRAVLKIGEYINNSLHLARKYAGIFVRGHYSFREVTVSYEEQICPRTNIRAYFRPKWRLLCLLSFKFFPPRAQLYSPNIPLF